jgi:hypothetical protein
MRVVCTATSLLMLTGNTKVADLTPEAFEKIPWQPPWHYVGIGEGIGYERELAQEAGPGHPLHDARAIAVGVRVDQDDVLFLLPDEPNPLAVVHLTYSPDSGDDPAQPRTVFYSSLDDWLRRGMAADHADNSRGDVVEHQDE